MPWTAPVVGPARRRAPLDPLTARLIGAVVIIAVFGAILAFAGRRDDDPWAEDWDPAVAPLVTFVEGARGHRFLHPVHVDLLDEEAFRAYADDGDDAGYDPADDAATPLLRAFGLVGGALDVRETGADLETDAALAFYDWNTKRITVRGTTLDASTRVTLVHELVHALQDQHFDLGRRQSSLDPDQYDSFLAVVEGDAERIAQHFYLDELDEVERREVDAASSAEHADAVYGSYPDALVSLYGAPYSLGTLSTELLARLGGIDEVDRAIEDPPHGAGYLLGPFARLRGDDAGSIQAPAPEGSELWRDEGSLGALFWYLVLEARLGPVEALDAVDRIEADAYVTVDRDGTTCVRDDLTATDDASRDSLGASLVRWAASMPTGEVDVRVDGGRIHVTACDPGATGTAPVRVDATHDALALPYARLSLALLIAGDGASLALVECASGVLAERTPIDTLLSEDPDAAPPDHALAAVRAECPGG